MLIDQQIAVISDLDITQVPKGTISRFWFHIVTDGMGMPVYIPVIVARGEGDGPVLGLTAALHGNELNGILVIQRLFQKIDISQLSGTIVGIPVVNVPSLLRKKRRFPDGTDLNHIMPGKPEGNVSQVYAWRLVHQIVKEFDLLIDLHTASFGRINSYYIRADMEDPTVCRMAWLQQAQIIVHNPPNDGTLRGTAGEMKIAAITLEVGDPNMIQKGMVRDGLTGVFNLLYDFNMLPGKVDPPAEPAVLCHNSYWLYTDTGGIVTVHPQVTERVKKGQVVATLRNIFGDLIKEYIAPEDGIVIGKSVHPVAQSGARILHLGIPE
ncbi:MAG: peptidase M14 [Bacteroidetes bacterium]|nr:MAG: peptidase M14 [Bacteroidota bacterium]PTM12434.1 MAG: peptidase M14 [Bacteroidota bacterium]